MTRRHMLKIGQGSASHYIRRHSADFSSIKSEVYSEIIRDYDNIYEMILPHELTNSTSQLSSFDNFLTVACR